MYKTCVVHNQSEFPRGLTSHGKWNLLSIPGLVSIPASTRRNAASLTKLPNIEYKSPNKFNVNVLTSSCKFTFIVIRIFSNQTGYIPKINAWWEFPAFSHSMKTSFVPSWSRESARWCHDALLAFWRRSVKVSAKLAIWLRSRVSEGEFDCLGPSRRGLRVDNRSAQKILAPDYYQTSPTISTHDWIMDF